MLVQRRRDTGGVAADATYSGGNGPKARISWPPHPNFDLSQCILFTQSQICGKFSPGQRATAVLVEDKTCV